MLPFFGVPAPALSPQPTPLVVQQTMQVDQVLKVSYTAVDVDPIAKTLHFTGDVVAVYGTTTLRCRSLRLDMEARRGVAEDGVSAVDGDSTLACRRLAFDWMNKTGEAEDATLTAGSLQLAASKVRVLEATYEVERASLSLDRSGQSGVKIEAESATIVPGKQGVARRAFVHIGGTKLGPFATYRFNLDERANRFSWPGLELEGGKKPKLSWRSTFEVGRDLYATGNWASLQGEYPYLGVFVGFSPAGLNDPAAPVVPTSDLREFASLGWFNQIGMRQPESVTGAFRQRRLTFGVGSSINESTEVRSPNEPDVSKPFDLVTELGGPVGPAGGRLTARYQRIQPRPKSGHVDRLYLSGTLVGPEFQLGHGLSLHSRMDGLHTVSEDHNFSWIRGEAGLLWQVTDSLRLGGAYVIGKNHGVPDFDFDRLIAPESWHLRFDLQSGPYGVSGLFKYDIDRRRWYDTEWEFSLYAGALQPYIQYRSWISQFKFGLRLRLDALDSILKRKRGS